MDFNRLGDVDLGFRVLSAIVFVVVVIFAEHGLMWLYNHVHVAVH